MKTIRLCKIVVAVVLVLLVLSASCLQKNNDIQNNNKDQIVNSSIPIKTYWLEERGITHTNEYLRLQQILPFTLVLPKTIPNELKQYPPQFRKYSSSAQHDSGENENIIEVEIDYQAFSGDFRAVHIWENNSTISWYDQDQFGHWDINGVRIQEQTSIDEDLSLSEKKEVTLAEYLWYWHNLRFQASVWGYSQDVSRKIIESMFEQ
jgi:hypothetical protein